MDEKREIKFYGATWCSDCTISKNFLDDHGVRYKYINIDEDPEAAKEVERINKGFRSIPTIVFPNGTILVEPLNEQLKEALKINH